MSLAQQNTGTRTTAERYDQPHRSNNFLTDIHRHQPIGLRTQTPLFVGWRWPSYHRVVGPQTTGRGCAKDGLSDIFEPSTVRSCSEFRSRVGHRPPRRKDHTREEENRRVHAQSPTHLRSPRPSHGASSSSVWGFWIFGGLAAVPCIPAEERCRTSDRRPSIIRRPGEVASCIGS